MRSPARQAPTGTPFSYKQPACGSGPCPRVVGDGCDRLRGRLPQARLSATSNPPVGAGLAREWSVMDAIACEAGSHRHAFQLQATRLWERALPACGRRWMQSPAGQAPTGTLSSGQQPPVGAGLAREWSVMDAIACEAGSHRQAPTGSLLQAGSYRQSPTGRLLQAGSYRQAPTGRLPQASFPATSSPPVGAGLRANGGAVGRQS